MFTFKCHLNILHDKCVDNYFNQALKVEYTNLYGNKILKCLHTLCSVNVFISCLFETVF